MGSCMSRAERAAQERSLTIDRQIEEESRLFRKECKVLLLGSDESDRSKIVKQMKIAHQHGYTREELLDYRCTIYKNLVESAQAIVSAMHEMSVYPVDPINRQYSEEIESFELPAGIEPDYCLGSKLATAIQSVWKDPVIRQAMDRSSEFCLMDSAGYFLASAQRICSQGYVPNEDDVLRARDTTTGVTETRFTMGHLRIHMFDVGRQLSERKKWLHCFEAVTSIIFCVGLSEYDQVLPEDREKNRLVESLALFESVVNSKWFLRTSIILLLSKIDIFKSKLPNAPLECYFPDYTGGADINRAAKHVLWRFTQTNRAGLSIYPHLTQATDTSNIRLVFAAVKETINQGALRGSGIL